MLSSLIDKALVEQRAKALGMTVDDKEITMAMETMAANNHMDVDTLKSKIVAQGMSVDDYRNRLKWQILQSKVINYEIRSKIVITEEKARQYYQQQELKRHSAMATISCRSACSGGPAKNIQAGKRPWRRRNNLKKC